MHPTQRIILLASESSNTEHVSVAFIFSKEVLRHERNFKTNDLFIFTKLTHFLTVDEILDLYHGILVINQWSRMRAVPLVH